MPTVQDGCNAFETIQTTQPDGTTANRPLVQVANSDDLAMLLKLILLEMRVHSDLLAELIELPETIEELRSGEADDL